ncbi:MAG: S8 family serine peptidase [Kiritimatiellales bacterium]|nr:S8 family serine peptidase [Kiritimatiellales bacterium]
MKKFGFILLLSIVLFAFGTASAASLRMEGGRMWLEAENMPLPEVLMLFQERGVAVFVDPGLAAKIVSGHWDNVSAELLMEELVGQDSFVLEWRRLNGPLGMLRQISAIHVFSDDMSAAKPLSPRRKVLDVVKGVDGVMYVRGEILIGFAQGTNPENLKELLRKLGGTVVQVLLPPGVYRIKLGEDMPVGKAMEIAAEQEGVKSTEPNFVFPRIENQSVSTSIPGEGVNLHLNPGEKAVAVFDSGLDPQYADLAFIKGTYNAVNPDEPMSDPSGHGTLTAMVASGAVTPLGATPAESGVPVLAVRTFDENGYTSSTILMNALNYVAEAGVDIINMSWGSETGSAFMETAIDYAAQNGMTLYAAAGNEPTGTPIYPAAYDSVIAVGGLNADGSQWENSNFGDFVEFYEPAKAVFNGQSYAGTSISSPYAAFLQSSKGGSE